MSADERLARVESSIARIEDTHARIADSLERLVRLETMHAETRQSVDRAFRATETLGREIDARLIDIGERLRCIETRQPVVQLAVYAVGAAVLGALAAAGAAVLKLIGLSSS